MLSQEELNTIKLKAFNDFFNNLLKNEKNINFSEKRNNNLRKTKNKCIIQAHLLQWDKERKFLNKKT